MYFMYMYIFSYSEQNNTEPNLSLYSLRHKHAVTRMKGDENERSTYIQMEAVFFVNYKTKKSTKKFVL